MYLSDTFEKSQHGHSVRADEDETRKSGLSSIKMIVGVIPLSLLI